MNQGNEENAIPNKGSESTSMISRKQWLFLMVFYVLYLFLGGGIFHLTERGYEMENLKRLHLEQRKLTSALNQIKDETLQGEIKDAVRTLEELTQLTILLPDSFKDLVTNQLKILKESSNINITEFNQTDLSSTSVILTERISQLQPFYITNDYNRTENQTVIERVWQETDVDDALLEGEAQWTMYNSFFFSFQTITTIGFGKLAPKTNSGKAFFLAYSLFGVAFNGIVFASLADLFSKKFVKKIDNKRYEVKMMIVFDAILYLIPGIVIFFILPALIFMIVENWDFLSCIYFVFVTLTTIGFGDMVSGEVDLSEGLLWLYRIFIHAWILFGLGYLLMIISFIQQALQSKQFRIFERKMKKMLKQKGAKSPANVQNDLNKLRSVLKAINDYKEGINHMNVNDEKEKDNNLLDVKIEDIAPGNVNLGFQADVPPIQRSPFPQRRMSIEMDPIEIFLTIASTVLKESEKKELLARVSKNNMDRNEVHDDLTRKLRSRLGLGCENIDTINNVSEATIENEYKVEPKEERKLEVPGKKLSIKRKLSAWTLNVLPASVSKVDLTSGGEAANEDNDDDDEDDSTQEHSDKINDLGDLINKVEEIVTQEITETNGRIQRSVSFDCVTSLTRPNFYID